MIFDELSADAITNHADVLDGRTGTVHVKDGTSVSGVLARESTYVLTVTNASGTHAVPLYEVQRVCLGRG